MTDEKAGPGRKPLPPGEKLVPITVKVEPATRDRVKLYGSEWVRDRLRTAKPPKPKP